MLMKIKFDTHLGLENAWLSRNQIRIRPNRCDGIKRHDVQSVYYTSINVRHA